MTLFQNLYKVVDVFVQLGLILMCMIMVFMIVKALWKSTPVGKLLLNFFVCALIITSLFEIVDIASSTGETLATPIKGLVDLIANSISDSL